MLSIVISVCLYWTDVTISQHQTRVLGDSIVLKLPTRLDSLKLVKVTPPRPLGGLQSFMTRLGNSEGLGSYSTVSDRGYLGKYQFHPNTLLQMKFDVSADEFLSSPELQDSALVTYLRMNARQLRRPIREFVGKPYNGVYITVAGILAGAHLVGPGGVLAFFYPDKYNHRTVDGNGTQVSDYMKKFAGYDLRGLN